MKVREEFRLKQTMAAIIADDARYVEVAKESIISHRQALEGFIKKDPFFQATLEPYRAEAEVPEIVHRMIEASKKAGIGPMSAVAGTISELAVEAMLQAGAEHAIVDNGGDIALKSEKTALIGIYAGTSPLKDLALRIPPQEDILGVCSSSGTVGPSISFGNADIATVISGDVALADACATALGNMIDSGSKDEIQDALDHIEQIDGVKGALVIKGDLLGSVGEMPEIIKANVGYDCITKA